MKISEIAVGRKYARSTKMAEAHLKKIFPDADYASPKVEGSMIKFPQIADGAREKYDWVTEQVTTLAPSVFVRRVEEK